MYLLKALMKSYSTDLKEKYPDGHWVTIKEGHLAGRHLFIVGQKDGSAKIVAGGGPFLKDKVLTGKQDPMQITVERPAPDKPVTVREEQKGKEHKLPSQDTSLKHSDENYRYRDIGHVPGSRKELAAAQATMIKQRAKTGAGVKHNEIDWDALEENPREAYDLITKEAIAKEVDWDALKAEGVEPGAGFLLSKLYTAVASKPEDSAEARKDFVFGLNALQERFEGAKTPEEVVNRIKQIREEMTGFLLTAEQQKEWDHLGAVKTTIAGIARKLKGELSALTEARHGPAARLSNLEWDQQKRIRRGWKPDPELQGRIDGLKKEVDAAQQKILDWQSANGAQLKMADAAWSEAYHNQENYKKKIINTNILEHPLTRGWNAFGKKFFNAINYSSYKGSDSFGAHVATAKSGKITDWSWLDKNSKPRAASQQSVHFQLKVAEKAERIGGSPLPKRDYSTEDLKKEFHLANVQSGNWVLKDLNSAKYHTEQCAAALQDMSDMLDIPTSQVSFNGRLSIAFGARGSGGVFGPGAAAHYEPKYRVINLTKMNGGGSLAHEWFHFIDDIAGEVETGERKGSVTFATAQPAKTEVLKAFQNLAFEMENGGHNEMVKTKLTITESERDHWLKRVEQARKSNFYGARTIQGIVNAKDLSEAVQELASKLSAGAFGAVGGNKAKKQYELYKQMAVAVHAGTEGEYDAIGYKPGSKFYVESQKIDAMTGGKSGYWQSRKEMAARAFAAYVSDKLHGEGRENTYLTSLADNKYYVMDGVKPYPEGEERTKINAAFDKLFAAMKQHDTLEKAVKGMGRKGIYLLRGEWQNDYVLSKSFSSDLQEKYPGGHWVTIKEGPLAGRHLYILPHKDGTAKIITGGGPVLKDKVLAAKEHGGITVSKEPDATDNVPQHEKYGLSPEEYDRIAKIAGGITNWEIHGKDKMGMGEFKRKVAAGEYPELIQGQIDKEAKEAAKAKAKTEAQAKPVEATKEESAMPTGTPVKQVTYKITKIGRKWMDAVTPKGYKAQIEINSNANGFEVGKEYTFAAGVHMESSKWGTSVKVYPVSAEQNKESLQKQEDDKKLVEIKRWLGYVEEKAPQGYLYDKGVATLRSLGIEKHPEYLSRLTAAVKTATAVGWKRQAENHLGYIKENLSKYWYNNGESKVKEAIGKLEGLGIDTAPYKQKLADLKGKYQIVESQKPQQTPKLRNPFPLSSAPPLNVPIRDHGKVLVYESSGKTFRIDEDMPSLYGSKFLGHEGGSAAYFYYREATGDEIKTLEAKEQKHQEKVSARKRLNEIAKEIQASGERPAGDNIPEGQEYDISAQSVRIYGGGEWFKIGDKHIWYVRNNGADGDSWDNNNVRTGGAGAIGWRIPYDQKTAEEIKRNHEVSKGNLAKSRASLYDIIKAVFKR